MKRDWSDDFLKHCAYALWVGFALIYISFDAGHAVAQTAQALQTMLPPASPTGGVDFGPIAVSAISALAAVLTVATGILTRYGVRFMASKAGFHDSQAEALFASRLNDIMLRAIDFAEAWSKTQIADRDSPIRHIKIDNFFMEQAVKYVLSSAPDIVKQFGLTQDRIEAMILSRLNAIMPTPLPDSGKPVTYSSQVVEGLKVETPKPAVAPEPIAPATAPAAG